MIRSRVDGVGARAKLFGSPTLRVFETLRRARLLAARRVLSTPREHVVSHALEPALERARVDEDDKVHARRPRVLVRAKRVPNPSLYQISIHRALHLFLRHDDPDSRARRRFVIRVIHRANSQMRTVIRPPLSLDAIEIRVRLQPLARSEHLPLDRLRPRHARRFSPAHLSPVPALTARALLRSSVRVVRRRRRRRRVVARRVARRRPRRRRRPSRRVE
mmetsp:Transcript_7286/g.29322  ORF Transcript_7286/g.29322 Transcript_7286/m.29322 type:complete len:219 (-) Transcript_7286:29-685(-)